MKNPKKLIRDQMILKLKSDEIQQIEDIDELNHLYALKIKEELAEIQNANHKDLMEFADLVQVVINFAEINGFSHRELFAAIDSKLLMKGEFSNYVLTCLNPENPSNKIYFE